MNKITLVKYAVFAALFTGCSKDYNIQLPPNKSELVVECYLEDGQRLRALISESTRLLDSSIVPFAYIDTLRRRAYNYGNPKKVVANYNSNELYRIDVYDNNGRHAYGETRFAPLVQIDSLTPTFNNQQEAFCATKFTDPDKSLNNYFRLLLHKNAIHDSLSLEALLDNSLANDKHVFAYGSGYDFKKGDVIYGTLYHLTFEYYQYLSTLQNSRTALVNPFAVSGEVVTNIKGGLDIFAALSYTRKSVVVP